VDHVHHEAVFKASGGAGREHEAGFLSRSFEDRGVYGAASASPAHDIPKPGRKSGACVRGDTNAYEYRVVQTALRAGGTDIERGFAEHSYGSAP